jgi:hypothetical protein
VRGLVSRDACREGEELVDVDVVLLSDSGLLARMGRKGDFALGIDSVRDAPGILLGDPSLWTSANVSCSLKPTSLSMLLTP